MFDTTAHTGRFFRKSLIRLVNANTQNFLHISTNGETANEVYAWSGTVLQARNLRDKMTAAGQDFPYKSRKVQVEHNDNP